MLKKFYKYLIDFFENNAIKVLGFIMFVVFIYFKFIRARLPKNVPFNLSVVGFIILLEICIIYVYIIWMHIRPQKKPNEIFTKIIEVLFTPLDAFDDSLKTITLIKNYYLETLFVISNNYMYIFKTLIFEILFFIIPRIVLIFVLILDIFYFSKLNYIYYVLIPMGILLFLRRYFIYSIKKLNTKLINDFKLYVNRITTDYEYGIHPSEWPENYDPDDDDDDIPPTMCLDVEIFINYYCDKVINKEEKPKIHFLGKTKLFYDIFKTHDEKEFEVYAKKTAEYKIELHKILDIVLLHTYILHNLHNNRVLKIFKLIIYSLYFVCWLYILIKSIHTLNVYDFFRFINSIWEEIPDPFSECTILSLGLII